MDILEYYIEKNNNSNWIKNFKSTSGKKYGKTFTYINTNFRSISSFENSFNKFISYNKLDRSKWATNPNNGQEIAKQWVVNLTCSKLFKKKGNHYILTEKGEVFSKFLKMDFNDNEKWILIYIFLLNSYFSFKPNYIFKQVQQIFDELIRLGCIKEKLEKQIIEILVKKSLDIYELFTYDIFWLISFYKDSNFIKLYLFQSKQNKQKLFDYVIKNYKSKNYKDVISYKYKPKGVYTKNTFIDDIKVLYFTSITQKDNIEDFNNYITHLLYEYKKIWYINIKKIYKFIKQNEHIFYQIFFDIFKNIDDKDIIHNYDLKEYNKLKKQLPKEKMDDTTTLTKVKREMINSILKIMAKEKYNYKCALEELYDCKYFTSKSENKNYLEVHHFIPKEFSNEFEYSIEILPNYIPLCPHCHSLIHHAKDRERKTAITFLYNKKLEELKRKKIDISLKDIYKFYHIGDD